MRKSERKGIKADLFYPFPASASYSSLLNLGIIREQDRGVQFWIRPSVQIQHSLFFLTRPWELMVSWSQTGQLIYAVKLRENMSLSIM